MAVSRDGSRAVWVLAVQGRAGLENGDCQMSRQKLLRLMGSVVAGGAIVVLVHVAQRDWHSGLISLSATAAMALVWLLLWWRYDK